MTPALTMNASSPAAWVRQQDDALHLVERISALGAAVSALEYLATSRHFARGELLSWEVGRTRYRWMTARLRRPLDVLWDEPGMRVLLAGRVLAAGLLVLPRTPGPARTASTIYLSLSGYAVAARSPYGSDGSETLLGLSLTTCGIARLVGRDPVARDACLWFLALQSSFAYLVAGAAKAASPVWRDGTAVRDVFRTRIFGERRVFAVLRDRPRLDRALALTTVAGELAFPAALVTSQRWSRALLGVGASFHVANAVVMGLNRFVPAFLATYPAIGYCAARWRARPSRRVAR